MPNWCFNRLIVTGDTPEAVQAFVDACRGVPAVYLSPIPALAREPEEVPFTFNSIVPVPPEVLSAGYDPAGRDWQEAHWGTKWDAYDTQINMGDCWAVIEFNTAWSPPEAWVLAASKRFPHLNFRLSYYELGCWFCGMGLYWDGLQWARTEFTEHDEAFRQFMRDEFDVDVEELRAKSDRIEGPADSVGSLTLRRSPEGVRVVGNGNSGASASGKSE